MDFYFSWFGNKRKEINEFIHLIDVDKYDTFVEPFGGSLAFSRYETNSKKVEDGKLVKKSATHLIISNLKP